MICLKKNWADDEFLKEQIVFTFLQYRDPIIAKFKSRLKLNDKFKVSTRSTSVTITIDREVLRHDKS